MDFKPHTEKQARAVYSDAPIVVLGTGIQFGKSLTGAVKSRMAASRFTDPTDNFLVLAPTYKILSQATIPAFLKYMEGCGEMFKVDMVYQVNGGGKFYFRTATDPNSIVGITDVRFIWGDEAGLFSLYFWENIQARAAYRSAQIVLTTSPYTLNWVYKELIRPKQRDPEALPYVDLIQAASWENPYMPADVIKRAREKMDPRRFNALFGGTWERMAGLVYDVYDEHENACEPTVLPRGTRYFGGIDWGYDHPFALTVIARTPDDRFYVVAELCRAGMTIEDICRPVGQLAITWNIEQIYCGPDQPASIEALNRYMRKQGIKTGASAANNRVRLGIDRVYSLFKSRQLKLFKGCCRHLMDEIDTYHYPEPKDLKPDQDEKEAGPVKQAEDCCDALRYAVFSLPESPHKLMAVVPGEKRLDHDAEWERLKRNKPQDSYG